MFVHWRKVYKVWTEMLAANFWVQFLKWLGKRACPRWAHRIGIHRDLIYATQGGEPLSLDLFVPVEPSRKYRPAAIVLHPGAWCLGDKEDVAWLGLLLAQRGIVAACVGYRLAPYYRYPAQLHDVQASIRWLRQNAERWQIDPEGIGAIGISAGGHLALLAGLREEAFNGFSSRINRVVALFAPTDLTAPEYIAFAEKPPPKVPNFLRDFLGATYSQDPDVWRDASPIFHVHPNAPPCFLIHGRKDPLVPYEQTLRFVEAMRGVGAEVTLVLIEGLGHVPNWRPHVFRQLLNAFEEAFRFLTTIKSPSS